MTLTVRCHHNATATFTGPCTEQASLPLVWEGERAKLPAGRSYRKPTPLSVSDAAICPAHSGPRAA